MQIKSCLLPKIVEPMLDYIMKDFEKSRIASGDHSIGAMVVCDSSNQAREMYKILKINIRNNLDQKSFEKKVSSAAQYCMMKEIKI